MNKRRVGTGFGPAVVSQAEVVAWQVNHGRLSTWELEIIDELEDLFMSMQREKLGEMAEANKAKKPSKK